MKILKNEIGVKSDLNPIMSNFIGKDCKIIYGETTPTTEARIMFCKILDTTSNHVLVKFLRSDAVKIIGIDIIQSVTFLEDLTPEDKEKLESHIALGKLFKGDEQ